MEYAHRICASCTGCALTEPIHCESIDCQWFYARRKASSGLELVPLFEQLARELEISDDEVEHGVEGDEEGDLDIYVDDTPSSDEEGYETGHHTEE